LPALLLDQQTRCLPQPAGEYQLRSDRARSLSRRSAMSTSMKRSPALKRVPTAICTRPPGKSTSHGLVQIQ
jgi:hypothetical protein